MQAWPQVTFNVGMTEAPDETAQGDWLNLVTKAGFSFLMAHVKFLRDGDFDLERARLGREVLGLQADDFHHRPAARQ